MDSENFICVNMCVCVFAYECVFVFNSYYERRGHEFEIESGWTWRELEKEEDRIKFMEYNIDVFKSQKYNNKSLINVSLPKTSRKVLA